VTPPAHVEVAPPGSLPYRITIGAGLAARIEAPLAEAGTGRHLAIVSSPRVWQAVRERLSGTLTSGEPILMPDGERHKHLTAVSRIYDGLLQARVDRATTVVAVGGGVVGDTAGFAAATFLRGLALVHVPTTLLAQVDSAIGGKVGVNHAKGKNLIGAFHQPRAVVVDPLLLGTLARREFRAGLYEVIKYGVIASPALFERVGARLEAVFEREPSALEPILAECCAIKAGVVQRDEREQGERRTLNFGHTAGHALEAMTRYQRFLHGEAVGLGMMAATALATARGALPRDAHEALVHLITQLGPLPPVADLAADEAVAMMRRDKKVLGGRLHFVLPVAIGRTEVVDDVTEGELTRALRRIGLK